MYRKENKETEKLRKIKTAKIIIILEKPLQDMHKERKTERQGKKGGVGGMEELSLGSFFKGMC